MLARLEVRGAGCAESASEERALRTARRALRSAPQARPAQPEPQPARRSQLEPALPPRGPRNRGLWYSEEAGKARSPR